MYLTTLLSSLPLPFEDAVRQAAVLGFPHVDFLGLAGRPESHREVLAETGLLVSCIALGQRLPEGQSLDAADVAARRAALQTIQEQLTDAAQLGATHGYLVPGTDRSPEALQRFAEACTLLADFAAARKVRLCVEHIPGRALSEAEATLTWLERLGRANLALLLDVGHCLISGEDAAALVRRAGNRLGYVHFDDNDGVSDLHWPLLAGRLTESALRALVEALADIEYRGALCLELNAANADPVAALRQGKELLERLFLG